MRAGRAVASAVTMVALLTTGCRASPDAGDASSASTGAADPSTSGAAAGLALSLWVLRGLVGADGVLRDPVAGAGSTPFLKLDEAGAATASAGCTELGGSYVQDGQSLTLTLAATSTPPCSLQQAVQQSDDILAAFPRVRSFSYEAGVLDLRDEGGTVLLSYRSAVTTLPGTAWVVTGVDGGSGSLRRLLPGTSPLRLAFGVDRTAVASSPCGRSSSPFVLAPGGSLSFTAVPAQPGASCGSAGSDLGPAFLSSLAGVRSWSFDRSVLSLRDASGQVLVELQPAPF